MELAIAGKKSVRSGEATETLLPSSPWRELMMQEMQRNEPGPVCQNVRDIYTRLNMIIEYGQDRRKKQTELVGPERRLDADWRFATIRRNHHAH